MISPVGFPEQERIGNNLIRVAVIGVDGHGRSFTTALNGPAGHGGFIRGARVEGVWARDPRAAKVFASEFRIPHVGTSSEDFAGAVDLAMILDDGDAGASHEGLAEPFLTAGTPCFIDRPLSDSLEGARRIQRLSDQHQVPIMTASALRFAVELEAFRQSVLRLGAISTVTVTGPGPWWFYGLHALELYQSVVGAGLTLVDVHRFLSRDIAVLNHRDGHTGSIHLLREVPDRFHVLVHGESGWAHTDFRDHWLSSGDAGAYTFRTRLVAAAVAMARTGLSPVGLDDSLEVLEALNGSSDP